MSVIKVILRKKPKADGTRPLAIRIYKDGQESYIYLGYYIKEDDWDATAQRVRKSYVGVSEICYTLFRGKLTTLFAGKEMQPMLQ